MTRPIRPGTNDVLLIVDIQNDFCPGGALAVPDGDAVVPVVNRPAAFEHIVLTQDWHPPATFPSPPPMPGAKALRGDHRRPTAQVLWPDHCVQGHDRRGVPSGLAVPRAELILRKGFQPRNRLLLGLL